MEEEDKYEVAVIFSHLSLTKILHFMEDYLKAKEDQIGTVRIDRFRNKNGEICESNRTIILMDKKLYQDAIDKGFGNKHDDLDFRIDKYKLNEKYLPNESQKANIFLKFSKEISYRDIDLQLREKIKILKKFEIIKHSYKLFIPLESRETEEHKGYGYLNFSKDNINSRALSKILLHDSKLYNNQIDNKNHLEAYWVKNKK